MILVCRHLRGTEAGIGHIRADGSVETQEKAEERLLNVLALPEDTLFQGRSAQIERAYDVQGERIAYVRPVDMSIQVEGPKDADEQDY